MLKRIILSTCIVAYSICSNSYDFSRVQDSSSADYQKSSQMSGAGDNQGSDNKNSMMVMNQGVVVGDKSNNQPAQDAVPNDASSPAKQNISSNGANNPQPASQQNAGVNVANQKNTQNSVDLPKEAQTNVLIDNSLQGPNAPQNKPANAAAIPQNNSVNQGASNSTGVQNNNNAQ